MTFASAVREYECNEEKLTRLGLVARQPGWACKLAGVLTSVVFMVPGLMFLANSFIGGGLLLDDDQTLPAEVPVPISLREVFGMFLIAVFGRVCRLNHAVVLILRTSLLIFPVLGEVPNGFDVWHCRSASLPNCLTQRSESLFPGLNSLCLVLLA